MFRQSLNIPDVTVMIYHKYFLLRYNILIRPPFAMFEYLMYTAIGFVGTLLGLEAAWHFTACKIRDKTIKPCMYKQIKLALVMRK
jgi:hypothetical protein